MQDQIFSQPPAQSSCLPVQMQSYRCKYQDIVLINLFRRKTVSLIIYGCIHLSTKCRSGIINQKFYINQINTFPTIIQYQKEEDARSVYKTNKQNSSILHHMVNFMK